MKEEKFRVTFDLEGAETQVIESDGYVHVSWEGPREGPRRHTVSASSMPPGASLDVIQVIEVLTLALGQSNIPEVKVLGNVLHGTLTRSVSMLEGQTDNDA